MEISLTAYRIFLMVILIIAVILIIQAAWSIWFDNTVVGDTCPCSGVNNSEINSKRVIDIILLIVGAILFVYAFVLLLIVPSNLGTGCKKPATTVSVPVTGVNANTTITAPPPPMQVNVRPDYSDQTERFIRPAYP
jgi:hypothetical protein